MTTNSTEKDRLFAEQMIPRDFIFDDNVAGVFEDMINRSVPGYATIINMIGVLAQRYGQTNSRIYDLGCSLGGASFSIASQLDPASNISIQAIDNSNAMIARMEKKLGAQKDLAIAINCHCADILQLPISDASVVVLNFTLQFVPMKEREPLMRKIYEGMRPGALLVISEKIIFPDETLNQLFIELYHSFKERMGYSKLEIAQKRAALENVMIPETLDTHRKRLQKAGFHSFDAWFQCFNFASMVAFK
jgi:tRNA (cmo5U34)-methyltransferase